MNTDLKNALIREYGEVINKPYILAEIEESLIETVASLFPWNEDGEKHIDTMISIISKGGE